MLGLDGVHKRVEAVVATYPCAQTPILEEFGYQAPSYVIRRDRLMAV
jgi:hypothetical protein